MYRCTAPTNDIYEPVIHTRLPGIHYRLVYVVLLLTDLKQVK